MIYLDYNATTPTDPRVVEAMLPYFSEHFGNASSIDHVYGAQAERAVTRAREQVAELIGAEPAEIVFTSGATEADNLAILGTTAQAPAQSHVVATTIEHPAVLEAAKSLGPCVKLAPVTQSGVVDREALLQLLDSGTALVSVMTANNETGALQPVSEVAALCRARGIPFHTDAVQSAGRMALSVDEIDCDLLSLSSHKMYGPKGVGALYVRRRGRRAKLKPLIFGGTHERHLRAGTLNVPAIVGFGMAAQIVRQELANDVVRELELRSQLLSTVAEIEDVETTVGTEASLHQTVSLRIAGVQARALMHRIRDKVAISAGSACATTTSEPSHVLLAQGLSREEAQCTIRISFGRFTTAAEIATAATAIAEAVADLRALAAAA